MVTKAIGFDFQTPYDNILEQQFQIHPAPQDGWGSLGGACPSGSCVQHTPLASTVAPCAKASPRILSTLLQGQQGLF